MYYFSLRSILKVYSIYIYIFIRAKILINQKRKTSLIINQRNNFLKLKKIVTTHERILGIILASSRMWQRLWRIHVSFAWQDIDTHRAMFRKTEVSQSVPYSREETVPRFRKIEIYRFVIHDSTSGKGKKIYFFFLDAFAKAFATEIDRIAFLEYRNCRKKIICAAR